MLSLLRKFLLLNPADLSSPIPYNWQLSALRIIVFSGISLVLAIAVHSSWQAYHLGFYYIIVLTSLFYFSLLAVLYWSRKKLLVSSVGLMIIILMAGLCIVLFIDDFSIAKNGIIFLYTLPLVAILFFGQKVAYAAMAFNSVPFALLIRDQALPSLVNFSITLPDTYIYINGLLFLFFNFCLPLATMRIIHTLKANSCKLTNLNRQLDRSHQLYEEMFDHIAFPTLLCDSQGNILKANSHVHTLFDVSPAALVNTKVDDWLLMHPIEDSQQNKLNIPDDAEYQLNHRSGKAILVKRQELTRHNNFVIHLEDISEIKNLALQLNEARQHQLYASYDHLTHLPSSILFMDLVNERAQRFGKKNFMLLAIIKICHLKMINHQYGYEFGNGLLKHFTQAIKQQLPADAMFCRLRGVKFALALKGDLNNTDPQKLSLSLKQMLPLAWAVDGKSVVLEYRLGMTCSPSANQSVEAGIDECEIALDQCTPLEPRIFFDKIHASQMNSDYHLAQDLREAIRLQKFELWLQPKVYCNGDVRGFEGLIRWPVSTGVMISPDTFIPLAERLGLIPAISRLVLIQAADILQAWRKLDAPYTLAINLAGAELQDDDFFLELINMSHEFPWLVDRLILEITETHLTMLNPDVNRRLHELHRVGFRLSIDDFGTGHASLSQLIDIPAYAIKLDKRFVDKITVDAQHVKIVQTTLKLAQSLNMELIVEGVETEQQYHYLMEMGCDIMQGYYFSVPQPAFKWIEKISSSAKKPLNIINPKNEARLIDG